MDLRGADAQHHKTPAIETILKDVSRTEDL
jgi:hypothetical protein